jgi:hypothetical protein
MHTLIYVTERPELWIRKELAHVAWQTMKFKCKGLSYINYYKINVILTT